MMKDDFVKKIVILWNIQFYAFWEKSLFWLFVFSHSTDSNKMSQGCGGGQVVSVLALNSDDPSLNPIDVDSFFCKNRVFKNENKQKETGVGP